jgi:hypothetical protein
LAQKRLKIQALEIFKKRKHNVSQALDEYNADARVGLEKLEDMKTVIKNELRQKWKQMNDIQSTGSNSSGRTADSLFNELLVSELCDCDDKNSCECSFLFEKGLEVYMRLNCRHNVRR